MTPVEEPRLSKKRHCLLLSGGAFSLVEIVMVIGIISFALVPVFALLPLGLGMAKDAMQKSAYGHIILKISNELSVLPFENVGEPQEFYFDRAGGLVRNPEDASFSAIVHPVTGSSDALFPGAGRLANLEQQFRNIEVVVSRAGIQDPEAFRMVLCIANSGR
jgi:uncharacterized protein (TIGR02598 family)